MLLGEDGERCERAVPVFLRLVRIDRGGFEQLARGVHDGDLAARADARIDAHDDFRAGGRGEQQVVHVAREDADGFGVRAFLHAVDQVVVRRAGEAGLPRLTGSFGQPLV